MKNLNKKLKILTFIIFLTAALRKTALAAIPGESEFIFSHYDDGAGGYEWAFSAVQVGEVPTPFSGYKTINIAYPYELLFNAPALPPDWSITLSTNAAGTRSLNVNILNPGATGQASRVKTFLEDAVFTLLTPGVFPEAGSQVSVLISCIPTALYVDSEGYTHIYEFVDAYRISWLKAYNDSRQRYFGSQMQGYLATITSIEEQMYLFTSVSDKVGWLGGTRAVNNADKSKIMPPENPADLISENADNYEKNPGVIAGTPPISYAKEWYWACGPEAGTVFYNTPTYSEDYGNVPSVFSFFSNPKTITNYPLYSGYVYSGGEPNSGGDETCVMFAQIGKASWNDVPIAGGTYIKGYYVEYGGYPFTEAPTGVVSIVPTLHQIIFETEPGGYAGALPAAQTVWTGETAAEPGELIPGVKYRNNKIFLGWFADPADETPFDFAETIAADLILYAKWALWIPPTPPPTLGPYGAYRPPKAPAPAKPEQKPPAATMPAAATFAPKKITHIPYVVGYKDGSFRPDRPITRAEAAMIFFNLITDPEKNNPVNQKFSDAPLDAWYGQAINYLAEKGAATGYETGAFRPNDLITRAEFATLAASAGLLTMCETIKPAPADIVFTDVPDSYWARPYISSAQGWITGYPDKTFRPENLTTRAEAVVMINKAQNRAQPKANAPPPPYNDIDKTHWALCDIAEASIRHDCCFENGVEIWENY